MIGFRGTLSVSTNTPAAGPGYYVINSFRFAEVSISVRKCRLAILRKKRFYCGLSLILKSAAKIVERLLYDLNTLKKHCVATKPLEEISSL